MNSSKQQPDPPNSPIRLVQAVGSRGSRPPLFWPVTARKAEARMLVAKCEPILRFFVLRSGLLEADPQCWK